MYVSAHDNILLQRAQASNIQPSCPGLGHFYSGSFQCSFICHNIKDQLYLPVIGKESLQTLMQRQSEQGYSIKEPVKFTTGSLAISFQTKIQAFTIPWIGSLITANQKSSHQFLTKKHLAKYQRQTPCMSVLMTIFCFKEHKLQTSNHHVQVWVIFIPEVFNAVSFATTLKISCTCQ